VDDVQAGAPAGVVSARFHAGLAVALARVVGEIATRTGISAVALSGGVFQNVALLDRLAARLTRAGHEVLTHARVPPNDRGISLGQTAVAAARAAR
jgi:hydrogenase maturation protein HypF